MKQAVEVNPGIYDMYARLVSLLIEDGKTAEALPYLTQMNQLEPSGADCKKAQKFIAAARKAAKKFMELHRVHWPTFEGESEVRPLEDM